MLGPNCRIIFDSGSLLNFQHLEWGLAENSSYLLNEGMNSSKLLGPGERAFADGGEVVPSAMGRMPIRANFLWSDFSHSIQTQNRLLTVALPINHRPGVGWSWRLSLHIEKRVLFYRMWVWVHNR